MSQIAVRSIPSWAHRSAALRWSDNWHPEAGSGLEQPLQPLYSLARTRGPWAAEIERLATAGTVRAEWRNVIRGDRYSLRSDWPAV